MVFASGISSASEVVCVGFETGHFSGQDAVSIGTRSGQNPSGSGIKAVSIGYHAANLNGQERSVNIGDSAGATSCGASVTNIGRNSGLLNSGAQSTNIGTSAGALAAGIGAVNVGWCSGCTGATGSNSTCVGTRAGFAGTGNNVLALGYNAGAGFPGGVVPAFTTCIGMNGIRNVVAALPTTPQNIMLDTTTGELYYEPLSPSPITTESIVNVNVNYTYTTAEILGGIILRDTTNNIDDTLPTPLALITAITSPYVGQSFKCRIFNVSTKNINSIIENGNTYFSSYSASDFKTKKDVVRCLEFVITNIIVPAITVYSWQTDIKG